MTRFKISVVIILFLVGMSFFSGEHMEKRCGELSEMTELVGEYFLDGDTDKAAEAAENLEAQWNELRKTASLLIHNNKLAELDRLCARAKYLAENKSSELIMELDELRQLIETLV